MLLFCFVGRGVSWFFVCFFLFFFFFKQKTAYEMRISDWSSDVCSSDLHALGAEQVLHADRQALEGARLARLAPAVGGLGHRERLLRRLGDEGVQRPRRLDGRDVRRGELLGRDLARGQQIARTGDGETGEIARHSRSEERRVGKECGSTFRSRWSPST